jgi:hypothetical protein
MNTPTKNILVRLPEHLANRLESVVPRRKRNKFLVDRVTEAIEEYDLKLSKIAELVNADEKNNPELQELIRDWEVTVGDGIDDDNAFTA